MARSNFGPEVKAAMAEKGKTTGKKPPPGKGEAGDTAAEMKRDAKQGIAQGSPQDQAMDMGQAPGIATTRPPSPTSVAQPGGHSPAHAAIAASIAHAILGKGAM